MAIYEVLMLQATTLAIDSAMTMRKYANGPEGARTRPTGAADAQ
jgi:hypothetical protein